ncbi:MAG TPA: GGDEF domain-containing protein [Defluviitoga sp.]|nr:GGDEF domain-containing protein [Defluviitoga sp.]HOP24420.1 GGDEF domain-containing protein [Defluviitoga sp.]HPZ28743.1 GGDEF domain-containing protein [Defluviitoga sp.]HQD62745.1 GGDEF domain-containing protein [Defluviitoga sp.]
MKRELPEKYMKNIRRAYINPGLTYVLTRFCDIFLYVIEVSIKIHEDPKMVPCNLYKFLKICGSFRIFEIKNIEEMVDIHKQRIILEISGEKGKVVLPFEVLIKDEVYLIYEIIKRSKPIISVILTDLFLNASKLGSVFKTSKIILEKSYDIETSVDEMIYASMTGITGGFAGAFNRAVLFKEDGTNFKVHRALGPVDEIEANNTYEAFETLEIDILPYLQEYTNNKEYFSNLEKKIKSVSIKKRLIMKNQLLRKAFENNVTIKLPVSNLDQTLVTALDLRGEVAFSPLKISQENFAFYLCDNRYDGKSITEEQLEILDYFAKQSAIIWQNKISLNLLKEEAELDMLTKIGNRRGYEKYISSLSYQKNQKIAVVIIDLDNFKEINDKYGHQKGDEILKIFANIAKKSLRKTDRIFRYGGDEFVVILHDVSRENVVDIVKRLLDQFYSETNCTFSAGVSYGDSNNINELFDEADKKLYAAKQRGKSDLVF